MGTNIVPFFYGLKASLLRAGNAEVVFDFDTSGCAVMRMAVVVKIHFQ